MKNPIQIIRDRIESRKCVQQYHHYKEWVLFATLVMIVLFLIVWSGSVNYKLTELQRSEVNHNQRHKEFNLSIIESQLLIIEYLKTNNAELHEKAIKKLTELNKQIKDEQQTW